MAELIVKSTNPEFKDRKLYFIHCPKNAGTAFLKAYCGNNQIGHTAARWYNPEIIKNSIAIIRNPYDRLVSVYEYNRMRQSHWHSFDGSTKLGPPPLYDICVNKSFAQFVKLLERNFPYLRNLEGWADHCLPQTTWLVENCKVIVPILLRFENLDEDIKKLGLPPLEKINSSQRKNWESYYTPELREIVSRLYDADFRLLEYPS